MYDAFRSRISLVGLKWDQFDLAALEKAEQAAAPFDIFRGRHQARRVRVGDKEISFLVDQLIIGFVDRGVDTIEQAQEQVGHVLQTGYAACHLPGYQVVRHLRASAAFAVRIPAGMSVAHSLALFMGRPDVIRYAEPDAVLQSDMSFTDSSYDLQQARNWDGGFAELLEQAWDIETGTTNVVIAILDTGVFYDHNELGGVDKVIKGYDYVDGDNDPLPLVYDGSQADGHGTLVAAIAAANGNDFEVVGIAPGSKLMAIRVGEKDVLTISAVAEAIGDVVAFKVDNQVDCVINASFGCYTYWNSMGEAFATAMTSGIVCVASSGNDNSSASYYPSGYTNMLAVGALDSGNWERASPGDWLTGGGSNYGEDLDVMAPGTDIYLATVYAPNGTLTSVSCEACIWVGCFGI